MSIFVPLIESSNVVSYAKAMQKNPPRCKRPQYASRNFMFPACAYMMRDVRSLMSVRGRGRYPCRSRKSGRGVTGRVRWIAVPTVVMACGSHGGHRVSRTAPDVASSARLAVPLRWSKLSSCRCPYSYFHCCFSGGPCPTGGTFPFWELPPLPK